MAFTKRTNETCKVPEFGSLKSATRTGSALLLEVLIFTYVLNLKAQGVRAMQLIMIDRTFVVMDNVEKFHLFHARIILGKVMGVTLPISGQCATLVYG